MSINPEIIHLLKTAQHVAILTGAGVSAESGVPTFRDAFSGLWEDFDPTELATPEAFLANPKMVWDWYAMRRTMIGEVAPNPGHHALVALESIVPKLTLITQNVDGLHQAAGSQAVLCLHGNLQRVRCFSNGHYVTEWAETDSVPVCPTCGDMLRPDVVWFGENLPVLEIETAFAAAADCDVFLAIGTSALVHPAASLPIEALKHGNPVIEINPEETPLTRSATYQLNGPSGVILPELVAAIT